MRFGERKDENGQLLADQNLQVGGPLFFNYAFKATGPNPIEIVDGAALLYVEPNFSPETQDQ
jgi:hypothetical protein